MSIRIFLIIICSVSLSALAQITLKTGMSGGRIQQLLGDDGNRWELALHVIRNPYVISGLAMYGFGAILWLLVLARLDVSLAYPFVGLGFILTMLLGFFVLSEPISLLRIVGTALVVAGVILISRF